MDYCVTDRTVLPIYPYVLTYAYVMTYLLQWLGGQELLNYAKALELLPRKM